jgi:N-acetylmuramoyl-L-alanine amidase
MPLFLSKIAGPLQARCRVQMRRRLQVRASLRVTCTAVLFALCAPATLLHAQTGRSLTAARQFQRAQRLRAHLLATPQRLRTHRQYVAVLNAYRAVYHGDPASVDAPKSVYAVAELLEIEGHQFHDTNDLENAREQYAFLRSQYPSSPLCRAALWEQYSLASASLHSRRTHASPSRTAHPGQETRTAVLRARAPQEPAAPAETAAAGSSFTTGLASGSAQSFAQAEDVDSVNAASQGSPAFVEGSSSMTRVLGLGIHRIVIDAGHGGHDSGTLGPHGLEEKTVVLDVALRLGRLLQQRLGMQVIYTRRTDTFIPLQQRTAIANRAHADLFLSIHANSSPQPEVRGVETYYLNFTGSPNALAVAARENAGSGLSVHDLSGLVQKIALTDKIGESRSLAADVQRSLYQGLRPGNPEMHNRGVRQAPFMVLIGARMPSILAEISFLTNASDAAELRRPAYRQRIAESLYRGLAAYVESMDGMRLAENASSTLSQ